MTTGILRFYAIGNEGGFFPSVVGPFTDTGVLMGPAERYDLIIDFSGIPAGETAGGFLAPGMAKAARPFMRMLIPCGHADLVTKWQQSRSGFLHCCKYGARMASARAERAAPCIAWLSSAHGASYLVRLIRVCSLPGRAAASSQQLR